jgi:hypothetical protein
MFLGIKKDRSQGSLKREESKERLKCRRQKENNALQVNRRSDNVKSGVSKDSGFSGKRISTGGFSYKPCETEPSQSSRCILQTSDSHKCRMVTLDNNSEEEFEEDL